MSRKIGSIYEEKFPSTGLIVGACCKNVEFRKGVKSSARVILLIPRSLEIYGHSPVRSGFPFNVLTLNEKFLLSVLNAKIRLAVFFNCFKVLNKPFRVETTKVPLKMFFGYGTLNVHEDAIIRDNDIENLECR